MTMGTVSDQVAVALARARTEHALRASLERQALAQRATKTGFWDWDIPTDALSWSPELFDLFGLEHTLEPTFERWLNVIHPDDRERTMDSINGAVAKRVSLESEYRVVLPDGGERWISALGDTTYDPDDVLSHVRLSGTTTARPDGTWHCA